MLAVLPLELFGDRIEDRGLVRAFITAEGKPTALAASGATTATMSSGSVTCRTTMGTAVASCIASCGSTVACPLSMS